jgi:CheY-like chemotaxis protein
VRHLVELHGGTVTAESAGPGKGASFMIRLPFAAVRIASKPDSSRGEPEPLPSLAGLRVLVVDDERDAREAIENVLRQCEAVVRTAGTVRDAIAIYSDWMPDVLVSDIAMPEEDGLALLQRLRDLDHEHHEFPAALAVTAFARLEDRRRILEAGFRDYLTKPVEAAALANAVAQLAPAAHNPALHDSGG